MSQRDTNEISRQNEGSLKRMTHCLSTSIFDSHRNERNQERMSTGKQPMSALDMPAGHKPRPVRLLLIKPFYLGRHSVGSSGKIRVDTEPERHVQPFAFRT